MCSIGGVACAVLRHAQRLQCTRQFYCSVYATLGTDGYEGGNRYATGHFDERKESIVHRCDDDGICLRIQRCEEAVEAQSC